jgi:hypothetical protein
MWDSLAHILGIPAMPEWADWFAGKLDTHKAIILLSALDALRC